MVLDEKAARGMKMLLLGATGLAGQAVARAAFARGCRIRTVARNGADVACDIAEGDKLHKLLTRESPDVAVNAAAVVNIDACAADPGRCWRVNARPAGILAEWSQRTRRPILHISTDHFFSGPGPARHSESEPVTLINEYARTKYAAEAMALTSREALVLRTSIVGLRGWGTPTLAEWAIDGVLEDREMMLFYDAWTSSLDTSTFASAALELLFDARARGVVNLAAREVYSKEAFVREMAHQLRRTLSHVTSVSIHDVVPGRATNLGLSVAKAEGFLRRSLPDLSQVVRQILSERQGDL
jgi:dTDP-4-dehydrorhamnose reductase